MTQIVQFSGKSYVPFLPMIDMNPSELSCVFFILLFVCREARLCQRTHVLTFDQPFFGKQFQLFGK